GQSLRVVDDQVGSPTYAADLAGAIWHLVDADAAGTYHFCNEGICSWYQFAREILRQCGLTAELRPVTSREYPQKALRPAWSAMDTRLYREKTGQPVRPWPEALGRYLEQDPDLPA
ncbi:MAG: sugar nucleotide-binding protein, partial [Sedimentisphaerales bacterium]|nr:sugar nucleotide-binding protein [Sedimentisphaerales bacterium]